MATANPTALFTTLPRTEFIQKNLGLVHSCAGRFTGRGIEYEELYSAGCLGLVKACDGFDPDRGVCFSTYAVPVILGEIKKLFRDGGTVKVSRSIKELGLKVTAERERLMKLTGAANRGTACTKPGGNAGAGGGIHSGCYAGCLPDPGG